MDYERIKRNANDILEDLSSECSYIEYKASASQLAKILKTICAYEITTMIMIYSTSFLASKK